MIFTRAMKKQQIGLSKLDKQAQMIQDEIEAESEMDPPSTAKIQQLQARLQGIQIHMQSMKDSIWAVMKNDEMVCQQEDEKLQSGMREAGFASLEDDVHQSMGLARQFVGLD